MGPPPRYPKNPQLESALAAIKAAERDYASLVGRIRADMSAEDGGRGSDMLASILGDMARAHERKVGGMKKEAEKLRESGGG